MDNGEIDLWSTHPPVLAGCVANTTGPVLEISCGHYSTRLLHALCLNRPLITIDVNPDWVRKFAHLESDTHRFVCVPNVAEYLTGSRAGCLLVLPERWAVVFEDSGIAQRRPENIKAVRARADLIIANNTEPDPRSDAPFRPCYRYEQIIPSFPYRFDYKAYPVWTSVLSDKPLPPWLEKIA